jgi:branched-chain amino acid transport system substrate-binding protein
VKQFVSDYKQFTGHDPDSWYAATGYDSVRILAAAITQAGSTDKTKIRDALRKAALKDSLLPGEVLKFGANGQVGYPFVIVQNQPGAKVEIVYPKNGATGAPIAPTP